MTSILERALEANAWFSSACAASLTIGGILLAGPLGVPAWFLVATGISLGVFAACVRLVAPSPRPPLVLLVIGADVAWVVVALVVIVGFPSLMSSAGVTALAAVTVVVAGLAVAQAIGLGMLHRPMTSPRALPAVTVATQDRPLPERGTTA